MGGTVPGPRAGPPLPVYRKRESGSALIMALIFVVVATSLLLSGILTMKSTRVTTETWFRLHGQAYAFARAGLIEALSWCRRQSTQPVTTFAPQLDALAVPPILDTDDPAIGLVREFEISGSLWGRYEVPLGQVADISLDRNCAAGSGTVWYLLSRGYVFRRNSTTAAFDAAPNMILTRSNLATEIRRLSLTPPAMSAICAVRGDRIIVSGSNARVLGGAYPALSYLRGTGSHTLSGGTLQGGTMLIPPDPSDPIPTELEAFGPAAVFGGVSEEDLRSLADDIIDSNANFPSPVPAGSFLFADCDLTFDDTRPLKLTNGAAILFVKGNVDIAVGFNPCYFSGFLYATGNINIRATSVFRGQIVGRGYVRVTGSTDSAEIEYDDSILNSLMEEIGQYRLSRAIYNPNLRE